MKDKNTLARVILWAVIVVILCGAFVGVLLRYRFEQANTEPAAPLAAADPTLENGSTGKVSAQEGVNNVADNESAAPDTSLAPWMRSFPLLPRPLRSPYRISARSR